MPASRRNSRRWMGFSPTEKMQAGLGRRPGGPAGTGSSRRWTGIEPARRGSPASAALKAVGPTRRPDTSEGHGSASSTGAGAGLGSSPMKKLILLAILVALGVVAAKKVKAAN